MIKFKSIFEKCEENVRQTLKNKSSNGERKRRYTLTAIFE